MASPSWIRSPRFSIFADACLLTAGLFVAFIGVGGALVTFLAGVEGPVSAVAQAVLGPLTTFAGVFAGPLIVWRAYHRKLNAQAVIGAFFGLAATAVVVGAFVALMLTVARPIMGDEVPAALALVGLFGAALFAAMTRQLAAAVRDLRAERAEIGLDRWRIASAALVLAFSGVMVWLMVYTPGSEAIEALPFMLLFSLIGGMMTVGASIVQGAGREEPPAREDSATV